MSNSSSNQRFTLLIDCPDHKGLVSKITKVLFENDLNIIRNDEFVSQENEYFFMRTEVSGNANKDEIIRQLRAELPATVGIQFSEKRKKNIVVLATKEHHCLSDILIRAHFNDINANILAVVSNYDGLRELTEKFSIPYHYVSHEGLSRQAHEDAILNVVNTYRPDFMVLAKYMRILTADFVKGYENRIVNIHHSFLPAFVGANPYKQAFDRGVKIIGATAHFVNNDLDEGPIISQSVIPVNHKLDAKDLAVAGRDVEKQVLSDALRIVFEDKIFVNGNKTIVFD